jgi:integrase
LGVEISAPGSGSGAKEGPCVDGSGLKEKHRLCSVGRSSHAEAYYRSSATVRANPHRRSGKIGKPLFYEPARARGGKGANPQWQKVGERLAEWVRESLNVTDVQPNYGWRHLWREIVRGTRMKPELCDYMCGHEGKSGTGGRYPKIGKLAVADIDTGQVLKVIEPIWPTKTETANRVRGRIEQVLDWCTVRGYRSGDNPARWKGHLANVLPARGSIQRVEHHPALPYTEVGECISGLREREGSAALALEFTILTAARTGEVIGAQWDEIDLAAKVWTVPAGRIKGGKVHRVPLSDRALEILKAAPREDGNNFVFIGPHQGGGLSNMAMASVLGRMGRDDITVHGFRSTFRDWAAETTGYANFIVEMALAHSRHRGYAQFVARGRGNSRAALLVFWESNIAADRLLPSHGFRPPVPRPWPPAHGSPRPGLTPRAGLESIGCTQKKTARRRSFCSRSG